ncbi:hypothetical protein T11_8291 [Trichinella zimbabwensis]|uniref:Uncharacterized protein n=1 Tax=Trichinella zimbabwensis TaxID=268475 RepID=A0A0V1GLE4_9BILA|nr:hypothetical protein T11_8291 [Trichinella zimbabwensis]
MVQHSRSKRICLSELPNETETLYVLFQDMIIVNYPRREA